MKKLTSIAIGLLLYGLNTPSVANETQGLVSVDGGHQAASTTTCRGYITSVPITIARAGTWCLSADISTSIRKRQAINIKADGVTIDCQNFTLDGSSGGVGSRAVGVYAFLQDRSVVRNCNIKGFEIGIDFYNSSNSVVKFNHLINSTRVGIILVNDVNAPSSTVAYNEITDIGSSSVPYFVAGIQTNGNISVVGNIVSGADNAYGDQNVYGIYTVSNDTGSVSDNLISGLGRAEGPGKTYGIYGSVNSLHGPIMFDGNTIEGDSSPGSIGVLCQDFPPPNTTIAKNNTISAFETGISGCQDGGGNVIVP